MTNHAFLVFIQCPILFHFFVLSFEQKFRRENQNVANLWIFWWRMDAFWCKVGDKVWTKCPRRTKLHSSESETCARRKKSNFSTRGTDVGHNTVTTVTHVVGGSSGHQSIQEGWYMGVKHKFLCCLSTLKRYGSQYMLLRKETTLLLLKPKIEPFACCNGRISGVRSKGCCDCARDIFLSPSTYSDLLQCVYPTRNTGMCHIRVAQL